MHKLTQIRKFLDLTQGQLAEILRVRQNTVSLIENGKISLVERNKLMLVEKLHVNPQWLESETGEMFNDPHEPTSVLTPQQVQKIVAERRFTPPGVPFFNAPVTGGTSCAPADIQNLTPSYLIDISPLNDCTFYRPVYGESMMPKYNPGDIIACKAVNNIRIILYGEAYLCVIRSGEDVFETLKILRKHADPKKIILKPANPNFGDTEIFVTDIIKLYVVKGRIERTL